MADRIFLEQLEARCVIGIYAWERRVRQKILIDLEFQIDNRKAARHDAIEHTVNYKKIAKRVLAFAAKSRYRLIETLAEHLAALLLREFRLPGVTVRISKPGAVRKSNNVGVIITRRARTAKP